SRDPGVSARCSDRSSRSTMDACRRRRLAPCSSRPADCRADRSGRNTTRGNMMAARSQNGWTANDRSVIATYELPGGKVALRKGDVATILLWVANQFHERVEPLVWPGVWGYAERPIRGGT